MRTLNRKVYSRPGPDQPVAVTYFIKLSMHVCMHVSMCVVIDSTRVGVVQLFKPLNTRISTRIKYVLSNYSNSKLNGLKLSSLGPHPNPFSILSGNKASEYFVWFFLVQPDLYIKYDHSTEPL